MKNFLRVFFCGLFFFSMGCCIGPTKVVQQQPSSHQIQRSDQIENARYIKSLTVALVNLDPSKQWINCTAMWVKPGLLLTAYHCVADQKIIVYETFNEEEKDGGVHFSIIKALDEKNDLALLTVDPSTEPPHDNLVFTEEVIESGEEVHIMGHTLGYGWSYSKGYVSSVRRNMEGPGPAAIEKIIQISSPAWRGNSGGGAFDSAGHFMGMCSWVSTGGPFLTFFIHRDVISKFLAKQTAI